MGWTQNLEKNIRILTGAEGGIWQVMGAKVDNEGQDNFWSIQESRIEGNLLIHSVWCGGGEDGVCFHSPW